MFEMFTDAARYVIVHAQEEAVRFDHKHIGPEHVMLGLLGEGEGVAARALQGLGVSYDAALAEALKVTKQKKRRPTEYVSLSSKTRKSLERSLRTARRYRHNFIGTEHLLLGLLHKDRDTAPTMLRGLGVAPESVRDQVEKIMAEPSQYTRE
ncbi:Clp protease N-terminal domain-containing protein [Nocardiopsis sp. FR26]|uniref:Clp protease N-terminal domain-containing protein n=1 Tax=Nocardiopsis sp. FR26 TaxID=2605987 RepID=UPI00135BA5AB|nr:Clp protease N-terminal domain-containing protein [Nocardiopsis sp. FR26]